MVQSCGDAADNPNVATSTLLTAPTDSQIYTALGEWMKTVLPAGTDIMQGQLNQTAQPIGPYCIMFLIARRRLATNSCTYTATERIVVEPTELTIQVSVFGNGAGNAVSVVQSLWRDLYAADFLTANGGILAPLYSSEPRQMQFVNGERQYEDAWSVDLKAQVNFTTTLPQQSATKLTVESFVANRPSTQE
ncbi:LIC_12616 family protein [Gluconobacter oxydans]